MKRTLSAPELQLALPADWEGLEAFARSALDALSVGDHPDAMRLRKQLAAAEFSELDYTGAGFFLTLRVPSNVAHLSQDGVIGDLHAEAPGFDAPLGVLLFVKEGIATMLEAFAYGDWPEDLAQFRMQYVRWEPHADGNGASAVNVSQRDPGSMWSG